MIFSILYLVQSWFQAYVIIVKFLVLFVSFYNASLFLLMQLLHSTFKYANFSKKLALIRFLDNNRWSLILHRRSFSMDNYWPSNNDSLQWRTLSNWVPVWGFILLNDCWFHRPLSWWIETWRSLWLNRMNFMLDKAQLRRKIHGLIQEFGFLKRFFLSGCSNRVHSSMSGCHSESLRAFAFA